MTSTKSAKPFSTPHQSTAKKSKKLSRSDDIPSSKPKRRKIDQLSDEQPSVEPRTDVDHKQQPSLPTDTLVTLLIQGVQNNDSNLLDQMLNSRHEKLIEKTVRTIPNSILLSLIDFLNKQLHQTAEKGLMASKWLRALLTTHTSYLMTSSDIAERLGPMYELIESRTQLYSKFARLQGKLSLISSQINSHKQKLSNSDEKFSGKSPVIFEDVSDDDLDGDQTQDELIPSPSEYDDYSGLSDDLDLGLQDEENDEEINESDTDMNFQSNGHSNDDDSS